MKKQSLLTKEERKQQLYEKNKPPKLSILEEVGNAITHGAGALFALIAMVMLLIKADTMNKCVAALIYGISMFLMMLMLSLIHIYGPPPQARIIAWGVALCDILAYLHQQSPPIIYRDLKPGNIMVKPKGELCLIDFGIARRYQINNDRDTTCLLYTSGKERLAGMQKRSTIVNERQKKLKHYEGVSMALANMAIMGFSCIMVLCAGWLYLLNEISFTSALMGSVLLLSSFGPVMALSNLSNNLLITMAVSYTHLDVYKRQALDILDTVC